MVLDVKEEKQPGQQDLVKAASTYLKKIVQDRSIQQLRETPSPLRPVKDWQEEAPTPVVEVREDPETRKKHYRINMMPATTPVIVESRRTAGSIMQ